MQGNAQPVRKLGKLPPLHDARTLQFEKYIVAPPKLPPMPPAETWAEKVANWGVMLNDQIGDCTCAAAGHMICCWTCNVGHPYYPADSDILQAYEDIAGYDPATGLNDHGAVELDVLNYWRKNGICGRPIVAYVALEPGNHRHVMEAVYLFGGCYIGLALPKSAENQDVWAVPPGGPVGYGAPGSWGGHAVPVVAYDDRGLTVITWGKPIRMTWGFWDAYCDEAYAVLSMDWFDEGTKAPSGFDYKELAQDLQLVTGSAPEALMMFSG